MKGFAPILKQTFSKKIISSIANLGEGYRKIGETRKHCWTGVSMNPDKARAGCAQCAGYIACISTRRKYILYKGKDIEPAPLAHSALEDEKKPEKGLSSNSTAAEFSPVVHERSLLKERTSSIIQELISAIKPQGTVIPEWPVLFLERHGIPHDEAVNIVEGLRMVDKLIQRKDDSWEVPG